MADCDDDWVTVAQEGEDDEDAQLIPKKGAAPNQVSFSLNGETVTIKNPDPSRTLLDYLRYDVGLTGTKGSCRRRPGSAFLYDIAPVRPPGPALQH